MKSGNRKQPAGGKFAGQFEDIAFRLKANKRHARNKAAKAARRKSRR